jgi:long-subunit fatty acid transport protein
MNYYNSPLLKLNTDNNEKENAQRACMNGVKSFFSIVLMMLALFFLLTGNGNAAEVESASSLNPVGSGARATGMGGAFIGVADDATAASWNPAGLIQLETPEISAVYSYFHRKQTYSNEGLSGFDTDNTMDSDGLNYASVVYPFVLFNRNVTVSLNYQRLYEMNKKIDYSLEFASITGSVFHSENKFTQEGFLYTLSPAMAVQVLPELYLGATLNMWDNDFGRNGWTRKETAVVTSELFGAPFETRDVTKTKVSFKGTNAHFGFLWSINGAFTLGGVYKTPFRARLTQEKSVYSSQTIEAFSSFEETRTDSTADFILRMPPSYGLGLAYRHSDSLTIAFDVYRTEWSKFVLQDENGDEKNPVDGDPISSGRLRDTTQVRLGTEYLFIRNPYVIPLRFGLFYDPEPQKGHLDEYYGFSLGSGIAWGRIVFDMSYQFRTGSDLTGDFPSIAGTNVDITQHTVMASLILYLK